MIKEKGKKEKGDRPEVALSHEGTRRKKEKEYPNLANEKFLGVRKGLAAPAY
ncbi:MAG: hypothetical protein PVH61_37345 [Candidatus Aminicenantes bacterium]